MVFLGLVTARRRATNPTSRSPLFENATTEGVVRNPSAFAITLGSPPSITATQELVVPKSIPMTLPMKHLDSNGETPRRAPERRGRGAHVRDFVSRPEPRLRVAGPPRPSAPG